MMSPQDSLECASKRLCVSSSSSRSVVVAVIIIARLSKGTLGACFARDPLSPPPLLLLLMQL